MLTDISHLNDYRAEVSPYSLGDSAKNTLNCQELWIFQSQMRRGLDIPAEIIGGIIHSNYVFGRDSCLDIMDAVENIAAVGF